MPFLFHYLLIVFFNFVLLGLVLLFSLLFSSHTSYIIVFSSGAAKRFLPKQDKEADILINDTIAGILKFAPHGEGGEKFKPRSKPKEIKASPSTSFLTPTGASNDVQPNFLLGS